MADQPAGLQFALLSAKSMHYGKYSRSCQLPLPLGNWLASTKAKENKNDQQTQTMDHNGRMYSICNIYS